MRLLLASGCVAVTLLSAAPSYAQLDVGSGLVGAGVGAVTGAFSPHPSYAYPYRGYVAHGGCRWIPAHYDRWGEWRRGHCARY